METISMLMPAFMLWMMLPNSAMESVSIPLSMMDDAIDDMFSTCSSEMAKRVKSKYLPNELKTNSLFKSAWKKAESCAKEKFKTRKEKQLTIDHLRAICVYTEEQPKVYEPFNNVVRTDAAKYGTKNFQYHTLYYWLVSALEILRIIKPCRNTYRRTNVVFTGKVNQIFRFGSFTSTSKNPNLTQFGKETCFYVRTCLSGYIKDYSVFGKSEREVIVPPYETFKILEIAKGSYKEMTNCKTIFVLKNAGRLNKLDCKAVKKWRPIIEN